MGNQIERGTEECHGFAGARPSVGDLLWACQ